MSETSSGLDADGVWVGGPGLIGSLRRYRIVIVAVTAAAAIVGYGLAMLLPAAYVAQASLYLRDPGSPAVLTLGGSNSSQSGDHAIFMATQAGLASSDAVLERASELRQSSESLDALRRSIAVAPSADLSSITIKATAATPIDAAVWANTVATAYQGVAGDRITADSKAAIARLQQVTDQRNAEFDALRAQVAQASGADQANLERKAQHVADLIGSLQVDQDQVASQAALYGSGVESFLQAVPPVAPSQPAPLLIALLGGVVGLIGASGWAWFAAGRNRRVEAESDAGAILGVPMLAELPQLDKKHRDAEMAVSLPDELDPAATEGYHFVLAALEHALSKIGGKTVAVASAGQGDGKTMTVLNLAVAARREGRKVLLVDGDERTRRLSQLCRDDRHFDVVGVRHDSDKSAAVAVHRSPTPRPRPSSIDRDTVLQIEPGKQNGQHPAVFFRSTAFGKLISVSGEPDDLVLIDTPALLEVSEAVTIADHADAVLLVVNRGTSVADLRRARERLAFTDTPLIGYLLIRGSAQRAYTRNLDAGRVSVASRMLRRQSTTKVPEPAHVG